MSAKKDRDSEDRLLGWIPGHGYQPKPSGKKAIPPIGPSAIFPVPEEEAARLIAERIAEEKRREEDERRADG